MNKEVPIDIVLTWVNGNDEAWLEQRNYWLKKNIRIEDNGQLDVRYRDWDNIQYIFRGIEKQSAAKSNQPKQKMLRPTD